MPVLFGGGGSRRACNMGFRLFVSNRFCFIGSCPLEVLCVFSCIKGVLGLVLNTLG